MPVHDWSRVSAGIFHAFHSAWITHLSETLNAGLLPPDYYALPEQVVADLGPDVLTLQAVGANGAEGRTPGQPRGAVAVALAPPRVRFTATAEVDLYALKRRTVTIRHSSEDRVVALVEVLSPGNKASRHAIRSFVDKAVSALARGIHLL